MLSSLYARLASSSIARRLARGSLLSLFGSATARILVLVAMILVGRVLGQVSFGELGLIESTLGMAGLMAGVDLGETATRFVPKYATSDPLRAGCAGHVSLHCLRPTGYRFGVGSLRRRNPPCTTTANRLGVGIAAYGGHSISRDSGRRLAGLEKFDALAKLNILDGVVSLIAMVCLARLMGVEGAVLGFV